MPATMTISLPDELKAFVEQQIKTKSFASASDSGTT
jgi:Arc/MetJ-type ribon-helix-helix transcriptional regulator